jgi:hypothetical protein
VVGLDPVAASEEDLSEQVRGVGIGRGSLEDAAEKGLSEVVAAGAGVLLRLEVQRGELSRRAWRHEGESPV